MLLADTSAWVEYLRGTGSTVDGRHARALVDRAVVVTDPVVQEVLSGTRTADVDDVHLLLSNQGYEPVENRVDWLDAAEIYRACRTVGETPRSQVDCLIAAVALRLELPVLQTDRDYDVIARVTDLELLP